MDKIGRQKILQHADKGTAVSILCKPNSFAQDGLKFLTQHFWSHCCTERMWSAAVWREKRNGGVGDTDVAYEYLTSRSEKQFGVCVYNRCTALSG